MPDPVRLELEVDLPRTRRGSARISARWDAPDTGPERGGILLAHGAGYHMESPFLERLAQGMTTLGFGVLRFNYPYRERALAEGQRMRSVDPTPVLEAAHARALAELVARAGEARPLLAGKSLGARIATHLAAKDHPCRGLVLFGYPLHPEGRPEKERSEHFPAIVQPALFLQGTRDGLCDLERLRSALERFGGRPTLEVLDTADHSFKTLKRSGLDADGALAWLLERFDRWEAAEFPR